MTELKSESDVDTNDALETIGDGVGERARDNESALFVLVGVNTGLRTR